MNNKYYYNELLKFENQATDSQLRKYWTWKDENGSTFSHIKRATEYAGAVYHGYLLSLKQQQIDNSSWIFFCTNEYYFLNKILIKMEEHFGTPLEHNCIGEGEVGNNSPSSPLPIPKKRINPCKQWLFTSFDTNQFDTLMELSKHCDQLIVGLETCPETERKHYQGFLTLSGKRKRPLEFPFTKALKKTHWIRKSSGSSVEDNYNYCTKEEHIIIKKGFSQDIIKIKKTDLRPHQLDFLSPFFNECQNDRTITYAYDETGKTWGKSYMSKYMVQNHNALVIGGNVADVFFGIKAFKQSTGSYPGIIIQDLSRSEAHKFNCAALEHIKNGVIFSTKYESGMMQLPNIHIIVFSNFEPDMDRLSMDRWNVIDLDVKYGEKVDEQPS